MFGVEELRCGIEKIEWWKNGLQMEARYGVVPTINSGCFFWLS